MTGLASSRSAQAASKRSQDQEQALVQAHKNWSQQTYNRRLDLVELRQRCVDAAQSISALKDCRKSSRKDRKSLRKDRLAYLNQVREDIGLPARQTKKRRRHGSEGRSGVVEGGHTGQHLAFQ